jgi:hypothetical protein
VQKLVAILFLALLAFTGFTRWQHLSEEPLIMTDGQGYYAYLPALFIYQDLQFSFVDSINQTYYPEDKRASFILETPTGNVNKYFAGTAVLQTPFFLAGCMFANIVGEPTDGYSWPFQMVVGLAALVYMLLGVYLLGQFLLGIGFKQAAVFLTLLLTLFGTNLLFYSIYEPSMSHAYSFFTISAFLFYVDRASKKDNGLSFCLAALFLGLTVLIRPTNGIIVLAVPVVTSGFTGTWELLKRFFRDKKTALVSVIVLIAIVGLQPLSYLIQTGSPIVWSYGGEGFDFLNPELYNVLFSYRKGLFIYCPALFLSLIGLAIGIVKNKGRFIWLTVFLIVTTWIIASWWMWYYGGSYGHRAFIEYYPFFAIGLAAIFNYCLDFVHPKWLVALVLFFVPIQLIQTYQYNKHIITFDNMTKAKYWNLFLRTGDDLAWYYSGYEGQDSYEGIDSLLIKHDFESDLGWGNESQLINDPIGEGRIAMMTAKDGYGPTLRKPVSEIGFELNNVRITGWVNSDSRYSDISFVCSLEDSTGAGYYWQKKPLRPQFDGTSNWSLATSLFRCGTPRSPTDNFVIYPIKADGSEVLFDDLEISFINAK